MALGDASLRALLWLRVRNLTFPSRENAGQIHSQSCAYKFTIDRRPDLWYGCACYLEPAPPSDPFNPFVISHFHSHHVSRGVSIPRIINVFRILPVATGVYPLQPQNPLCALRPSVANPLPYVAPMPNTPHLYFLYLPL